jgi:predicted transcriptional regulator
MKNSQVLVQDVEVVMRHVYLLSTILKPNPLATTSRPSFVAQSVLLGFANQHHTTLAIKACQVFLGYLSLDDGDLLLSRKPLHLLAEGLAYLLHHLWRRNWPPFLISNEIDDASEHLQILDVPIQVHPVNALDIQVDLVSEYLFHREHSQPPLATLYVHTPLAPLVGLRRSFAG